MNVRFWIAHASTVSLVEFIGFLESAYVRRRLAKGWRPKPIKFGSGAGSWKLIPNDPPILPDHYRLELVKHAGEILSHSFDLLGSGIVDVSRTDDPPGIKKRRIAWHRDACSGFTWEPGLFYSEYLKAPAVPGADVKFTRELSRFQHLSVLGQAYRLTRDERYTEEFCFEIADWISENPFCQSINWDCAMDVAIRAANWIVALDLFHMSPQISSPFLDKIEDSLREHAQYIMGFLEYGSRVQRRRAVSIGGNHYLADLCGLLFIVLRFPTWKESVRWKNFALRQFYREVENQFSEEGVHYEFSIAYHRLALELTFFTLLMLERNGEHLPEKVAKRVEKAFEFVLHYTKPDGTAPLIGDADDGQFVVLGKRELASHCYLLCIGALYFERMDFASVANSFYEPAVWIFGPKSREKWDRISSGEKRTPRSRQYPRARMSILRADGGVWLFASASGPGILGHGGHTHNDLLSFELSIGNANILVDSGTFVYTRSPDARNLFRGTRAHNTVLIDGMEQQRLGEAGNLWTLADDGKARVIHMGDEPPSFDAEHFGFARLPEPVVHRRTIAVGSSGTQIRVTDEFRGSGAHEFEWNWHFHPDVSIEDHDRSTFLLRNGDIALLLFLRLALPCSIENSRISPRYGITIPAQTLRMQASAAVPSIHEFLFQRHK